MAYWIMADGQNLVRYSEGIDVESYWRTWSYTSVSSAAAFGLENKKLFNLSTTKVDSLPHAPSRVEYLDGAVWQTLTVDKYIEQQDWVLTRVLTRQGSASQIYIKQRIHNGVSFNVGIVTATATWSGGVLAIDSISHNSDTSDPYSPGSYFFGNAVLVDSDAAGPLYALEIGFVVGYDIRDFENAVVLGVAAPSSGEALFGVVQSQHAEYPWEPVEFGVYVPTSTDVALGTKGFKIDTEVDVEPIGYGRVADESRVGSRLHRNVRHTFPTRSLPVRYVNSATRYEIQKWWRDFRDIFIHEITETESLSYIFDVDGPFKIVGDEAPLREIVAPYDDAYAGVIELEGY